MASGYKVSKDQQQVPIEVKNKRSSNDTLPKKLLKPKLGGGKNISKALTRY